MLEIETRSNLSPWSERSFRHEIDNPQGFFLVAELDGEVVGYGGIWMVVDEAHVTTIAVDEASRCQGIGRELLVELLKKSKQRGATCSTLEVRAGNENAIALYESMGYKTVARRKNYYPVNQEDALVMWRYDLDQWNPEA